MTFEIDANAYAIRVYGDHPDNYLASAQVRAYGDRGWMSSITGAGFYKHLRDHLPEVLQQCGVRTLEGYMTDSHARLLARMLRGRGRVSIGWRGICSGREMPWVILTAGSELEPMCCNQCGKPLTHMGHGYFYCAAWKSHPDPETFL